MNDLAELFKAQDVALRWKAERENATARLELAKIKEHCAFLISQHDPVASLGIDREKLRIVLKYIMHGDLSRLNRDYDEIKQKEEKC